MPVTANYATPLMHVGDVEQSIRFYRKLGFKVIDTDGCTPLGWARLHCDGGAVMFLRAEGIIDPAKQGIGLYMYTPDLVAFREQLIAAGVKAPAISRPPYMQRGELTLKDPDGYHVFVGHWDQEAQEAWEKRLKESPPAEIPE